jgi:hypothetical protein
MNEVCPSVQKLENFVYDTPGGVERNQINGIEEID